ncbi:MAG: ribonuclease P protein component [Rikenellaceae bacterium]
MGVGAKFGLPREERLRGVSTVSRLFGEGESVYFFPLRIVFSRKSADDESCQEPTSVLFSVPKKLHKRANKRNLLRRRVKEAYRLQKSLLGIHQQGLNIAIIYSTKELLSYDKIARAIERTLPQIVAHHEA